MKIVSLIAENIKKLVAVEIHPDGNIVQITGANGAGKSSVLDSIFWALAGTGNIQKVPIRNGEEKARIRLDLGEILVTRTFKPGKNGETVSAIVVENAEGAKFPSPQSMLDGLLGKLAFDPLEFSRMESKEQFDLMRGFIPDVDFEGIELANKADYDRRTDLNRRAKEMRVLADKIVVAPDVPAERIDESDLIDQMEKGAKHNSNIETRKANRNQAVQDIAAKLEKGLQLRAEAERIIAEADKLAQEAGQLKAKLESAPPLPEPIDLSVLRQKIAGAKGINQAISDKEKKTQFLADAERIEAEAKKLTDNIAEREAGKMLSISIAQLPVEGIAFGDGEVLMNGVPLDQASDAEKIKISVAIAMALNPKLKVIRIRDGSLLDASSMKIIADMAAEKDFQIWVEKVDESGKIGFVIEDGQLKTENKLQEKTAI